MEDRYSRIRMLYGEDAPERLAAAKVAVFGIGGVGGYIAEALARSGVGTLVLIDSDTVKESNLNRQIIALGSTLGMTKTDAAEKRIADIAPDCRVIKQDIFYTPETADLVGLSGCDYAADAIDTVTGKLEIIMRCKALGIPVISCMGTGNKIHPELLELTDIYKTSVCPLARVMRHELRKRGIGSLTVVYSREEPRKPAAAAADDTGRRSVPSSAVFVPAAAGMIAASKIVNDILGVK